MKIISFTWFWINIPLCFFIGVLIFRIEKKYRLKKKEIEEMINSPGMEEVRWLLKERFEKHGIKLSDCAQDNFH